MVIKGGTVDLVDLSQTTDTDIHKQREHDRNIKWCVPGG